MSEKLVRLSVASEKKVARKIFKESLWKTCMPFVCVLGEGKEKGKEIAVYILSYIFIVASLILYELNQLEAYSSFSFFFFNIQSMDFLMSLKYAGCNVFFFFVVILFLGKHLLQCLLPTYVFLN